MLFRSAYLQKMVARDTLQVKNMVRLIDDMLDVTRLRNSRLSIRPSHVNLPALLERVVGNLANQAALAGCAITLHADQQVTGFWDEFRIEQVVINLLTNALRYGKGQPVAVRMTPLDQGVRIDVRDGGCGISQADQQRIFGQFERAAAREGDETGGLGLGLYITHQLVQAHGGSIAVESQPGEGSVFTVRLPLQPPLEPAIAGD